jgi:hypothetical protein
MDAIIMFDNDARACYDQIIPSLAAMMSCRAGMTWNGTRVVLIQLYCSRWNIMYGRIRRSCKRRILEYE